MQEMTGKERISNILQRKPVDRIGLGEHFWGDTRKDWLAKGHIKEKEWLPDHFGFDIQRCFYQDVVTYYGAPELTAS